MKRWKARQEFTNYEAHSFPDTVLFRFSPKWSSTHPRIANRENHRLSVDLMSIREGRDSIVSIFIISGSDDLLRPPGPFDAAPDEWRRKIEAVIQHE